MGDRTSYDKPRRRGEHKIFIGMAPGVGKTYRMLEEAQQLKQEGIDVVIGLLETHGRQDTIDKAKGLEQVPRQSILCSGRTLTEMDTDGILSRQPQLVLVDELAHTNVPGSEREKRYQDVEIILNAGINVYSTVNIQHLESLNDLVLKISSIVVRERIPDRILDEADEVVVIDVTPETLEERLRDGKIYAPEKIDQALHNFFQRRNLIALRELALREVADNVEETGLETTKHHYCSVHERVLVCVSTYSTSLQLLRRGGRIANHMNGRLYGLFVENPDRFLSKQESLSIETCEKLCCDLEGEFLRIKSHNIVETITRVARVGETRRSRWDLLIRGSMVQKLMRTLPDIDLHIIATEKSP